MPQNSSVPLPFDRVAESYDATRGGAERGRWIADALHPWIVDGGRVLEVGVGTGVVAAALRVDGLDVVGVDLSLPMLRRASDRLPGRVAAGDASQLPLRSGSVSTAYLVHVLHLVDDMQAVFREAARVLNDGGRVLATCGIASEAPTDEVGHVISAIGHFIEGRRGDGAETVLRTAQSTGLQMLHREKVVRRGDRTPLEIADLLETRSLSWTWEISGDQWQREVVPVIAALRALPRPDRPRQRYDERTLFVFSR